MTRPSPKVSVVCAWYNRADYIRDTVDSLLAQDYPSFDITVVNDGSPEPRVREILDSYDDPRLRVIHQKNTGFTRAIRRAIDESDGTYIAVQGAGDVSLPGRLSAQVAYLEKNEKSVVSASLYELIDEHSQRLIMSPKTPSVITEQDLRKSMPITHGTFMYRRTAYDKIGGYNPVMKYAQDWEFLLRITRVGTVGIVQEIHYRRYTFGDGATYDPGKRIEQRYYVVIARTSTGMVSEDDLTLVREPQFVFMPRNIPETGKIIVGNVKRGTFRFLPKSINILMRQIFNLASRKKY